MSRRPIERAALVLVALTLGPLPFAAAIASSPATPAPQQMPDLSTPGGLYRAGCQSCHGADGRGVDLSTVGFDTPLPDFTDCSFATREPDADWSVIAHQGGPVRGFNQSMPAYGEAFTDEQIAMVVGYLRTFCTDGRWPRGELNFPRAFVTEKAYPEDEFVFTLGAHADGPGGVEGEFLYERRVGPAGQIEAVVPVGVQQVEGDGPWLGGLGDIELGYKHTLVHRLDKGMIVSGGLDASLPTGSEEKGLGKGTFVFEPFVSAGFALPRDSYVHAQVGVEIPADHDVAHNEAFWRAVLGTTFSAGRWGRAFSPMIEVLGVTEFEDDETVNLLDVLPQVQVSLNTRQHILASFGVRVPVNHTVGRATQVVFYLLWDWFDGGFFDGW